MKTITMYELLGLIKDGKAPKKIKNINSIWEYEKDLKDYYSDAYKEYLIHSMNSIGLTEREVEIIEEEKKIPDKLDKYADVSGDLACEWSYAEKKLKDKIDEIIDYLHYLKSKGE